MVNNLEIQPEREVLGRDEAVINFRRKQTTKKHTTPMNGLFVGKRKVTAQVTRMTLKLRLFYLSQDPEQLGPSSVLYMQNPPEPA